jgi:hypothetical protein
MALRVSPPPPPQSLVCLNGDVIKRETISSMPAGNAKFLMDSVFELAQRINRFRLADAEIGLFCAVVIITAGIIVFPSRSFSARDGHVVPVY